MWWSSLATAPEPLTRGQRWAVIATTAAGALSRGLALARTPWDWDEMLFMRAVEHFDVASHRPHPPGFPLFVLFARFFRLLGFDDFCALQALNFVAAIAIVPAAFFLCRELRMRFAPALSAALLLAFLPNVWVYGGGAFSDVPSMVLVIVALALLFAGCRGDRAYLAGAVALAIAAGFRPQNLLVGFVPFIIASSFRSKRVISAAIVTVTIVVGASYGVAAWLTGWAAYREALETHREYILRVDSFLSPTRPSLWRTFVDFFVRPFRAPLINAALTLAAIIGVVRHRMASLLALAAFGPLCIFSWLMLDHFSTSRFSIGYAPLIAILAAEGFDLFVLFVVIACVVWTWPALTQLRTEVSPPVAAVQSIPQRAAIDVDAAMVPFAEWYRPDSRIEPIGSAPPPAVFGESSWWLHEVGGKAPQRRLWDIFRKRYFSASATPLDGIAFGDGWYGEEGSGAARWRWMASRAAATLPPRAGNARLTLRLYVPLDILGSAPDVTVRVNGAVVDQFRATSRDVERTIDVRAHADRPNALSIETDRVARPPSDPRVLGLRLNALVWSTGA